MNVVIEELKQSITATAAKARCQGRVDSYRQNRLFENNQRQFYRELDQEEDVMMIGLWLKNRKFWGNICDTLRDFGSVTIWLLHGRSSAC